MTNSILIENQNEVEISSMEQSAYAPGRITLEPYISEADIQTRLDDIAAQINASYADEAELVVVAILRGSFMFLADLVRRIDIPCQIEFVRLASYEGTGSTGTVKPVNLSLPNLTGKSVLVVEDIIDTGLTMKFFMEYLHSVHSPKSVELAVLLDKKMARQHQMQPEYVGFEIKNEFVVGYGLDADGYYRNLPEVCILKTNES